MWRDQDVSTFGFQVILTCIQPEVQGARGQLTRKGRFWKEVPCRGVAPREEGSRRGRWAGLFRNQQLLEGSQGV